MDLAAIFNNAPFARRFGITVTDVGDGHATVRLPYDETLRSTNHGSVIHGGATYALADTAGGAAVVSRSRDVSPTVDMRIDYLAPATTDLQATGEVIRYGSNLAVAHVNVHDQEGTRVATAQGTYKTGGQSEASPWHADEDGEGTDDTGE